MNTFWWHTPTRLHGSNTETKPNHTSKHVLKRTAFVVVSLLNDTICSGQRVHRYSETLQNELKLLNWLDLQKRNYKFEIVTAKSLLINHHNLLMYLHMDRCVWYVWLEVLWCVEKLQISVASGITCLLKTSKRVWIRLHHRLFSWSQTVMSQGAKQHHKYQ